MDRFHDGCGYVGRHIVSLFVAHLVNHSHEFRTLASGLFFGNDFPVLSQSSPAHIILAHVSEEDVNHVLLVGYKSHTEG
jgi:hypothetical protein